MSTLCILSTTTCPWLGSPVREWMSSCLTAHQHNTMQLRFPIASQCQTNYLVSAMHVQLHPLHWGCFIWHFNFNRLYFHLAWSHLFQHWHVSDPYILSGTRSFAVEGSRYGRKGYTYLTDWLIILVTFCKQHTNILGNSTVSVSLQIICKCFDLPHAIFHTV